MLGLSRFSTQPKRVQVYETPTQKQVRQVLHLDPVWAAYALADLQPAFSANNRWLITKTQRGAGLLQLFDRLSPPILFAMGDEYAVGEALVRLFRPESVYVNIREEHLNAVTKFYDLSMDQRFMWRMVLTDVSAARSTAKLPSGWRLVDLNVDDAERIRTLYAYGGAFAPDAFQSYQLESGFFCGVESSNGILLSVGGTHIVDHFSKVAAIGNMYTHPARRGIGLASLTLERLVSRLVAAGLTNVVLNVDQRNEAAQSLYENHGFNCYCPYMEGVGKRK